MGAAFAKAVFGPPAPSGLDTNKGAMIADVQNGVPEIVDSSGNAHGIETALTVLQAQTALSTVTTAQNLFTQALNAGQLNKLGRTLRVKGTLIFTTADTSYAITVALKIGAVSLVSIATATITNAETNGQIQFEFEISVQATGASGKFEAHGKLWAQGGSGLGVAVPVYLDQNTAVSSAVNLTASGTMACTIASSGSAGLSSCQVRQAVIQTVN